MQIYKSISRSYIFCVFIFFVFCLQLKSQGIEDLKKNRCLKNMPKTFEEIQNQDTIYILYHKSDKKGFEQNVAAYNDPENDSYYFYNYIHFPLFLYDREKFDKINIRKPKEQYKKKSFICKNLKKVIDVNFLKKYGFEFYTQFYEKKRVTFIIDLDVKKNNKYKIVEVNNPTYIID